MHGGDHQSQVFEELVAQYQAKVFRLVYSLVRNAERLCPYAKMARQGTVNIVAVVD